MFTRSIVGRKAPYVIKFLTKMQLSEFLSRELKIKNIVKIKGLLLVLFSDAPLE